VGQFDPLGADVLAGEAGGNLRLSIRADTGSQRIGLIGFKAFSACGPAQEHDQTRASRVLAPPNLGGAKPVACGDDSAPFAAAPDVAHWVD